ncbi:AAA family ATPase [uncultured Megasphaera sp.]|uniref:AAA family ATPase n=1 Tax=uncultured Megasphaera sp. TaxID=165188 RepID=UPI0025DD6BAA|nr:AAA family ATPase [uncultured Megasphaera sp.]
MGLYLNPGAEAFLEAVNSEIYVDKTGLIRYTNKVLKTQQKYVCVSRPRRFGKSIAANMICAYYDRTVDGKAVFRDLQIADSPDDREQQSQYDVLRINMQEFLSRTHDIRTMISRLNQAVLWDVLGEYPDFRYFDKTDMIRTLADIYSQTKRPFIIVIDEWDCIFREYPHDKDAQRQYLDFLRDWLKDKTYIALAYMTGILPIREYDTHFALQMFTEFSIEVPNCQENC